jgi:hypothetical protein
MRREEKHTNRIVKGANALGDDDQFSVSAVKGEQRRWWLGVTFFFTSTKNWVKGIWGGVLQLLNHEPAKFARKESIRNLPQTDI